MVTLTEWLRPAPNRVIFPVSFLWMESPVLNAVLPDKHVPVPTPKLCALSGLLAAAPTLISTP